MVELHSSTVGTISDLTPQIRLTTTKTVVNFKSFVSMNPFLQANNTHQKKLMDWLVRVRKDVKKTMVSQIRDDKKVILVKNWYKHSIGLKVCLRGGLGISDLW